MRTVRAKLTHLTEHKNKLKYQKENIKRENYMFSMICTEAIEQEKKKGVTGPHIKCQ